LKKMSAVCEIKTEQCEVCHDLPREFLNIIPSETKNPDHPKSFGRHCFVVLAICRNCLMR
jgi:hypothetical protein